MTAPGARSPGERIVAAALRCYPPSFRARYGPEMLSAYLDQRDALAAGPQRARPAARTVAGLLRALPAVRRVGATSWLPANGEHHRWSYAYLDDRGEQESVPAQVRVIHGDYLEAMGSPCCAAAATAPGTGCATAWGMRS